MKILEQNGQMLLSLTEEEMRIVEQFHAHLGSLIERHGKNEEIFNHVCEAYARLEEIISLDSFIPNAFFNVYQQDINFILEILKSNC